MRTPNRSLPWIFSAVFLFAIPYTISVAAQGRPPAPAVAAAPSQQDTANTQEQLIKLLRLSPTLTTVVAHDPSLLADQPYVSRNNPELAQFLTQHPEVVRNPEFYLFTNLDSEGGRRRDQALQRAVWPELVQAPYQAPRGDYYVMDKLVPVMFVLCFLGAIVWMIRLLVESRRTGRFYKMQSELHMKLIDKLSNDRELAAYLESEAGKRLFEGAPVQVGIATGPAMPNVVARVLAPLQIGVVLALLGIGLLSMPGHDTKITFMLGILALMPGIGFILSAGATWLLARRLGLLPKPEADAATPNGGSGERL